MGLLETLTQEQFRTKADLATSVQPVRKTVSLGNLEILGDALIKVEGKHIPMTPKAFAQLATILGVPIQFQGRVDKLFGSEAKKDIVNKMKSALIRQGMSKLTLVASPTTKEIVGFLKKENSFISHQGFFGLVSGSIGDQGLSVRDFTISEDGTSVTISCFDPRAEYAIEGLKDEFFQGGVTFHNSIIHGTSVSPYINRLVCLNGMIGAGFNEDIKLKDLSNSSIEIFRGKMLDLSKRDYQPKNFIERAKKAMETHASYSELESSSELILNSSNVSIPDLSKWLPYLETNEAFAKFGLPPVSLTPGQKKAAKTGTTMWELVNGLTHFSTHNSEYKISEDSRRAIQRKAGDLLAKTFDIENLVLTPFS